MSLPANTRHSLGLFLISVGIIAILAAAIPLVLAAKAGEIGGMVCAVVFIQLGTFIFWRGIMMRNRAAPHSTAFNETDEWTTRTGSDKPSFLEEEGKE